MRWRRRVLPVVHRIAAVFGGYAQCVMDDRERVGVVPVPPERCAALLQEQGFRHEPVASLKRNAAGDCAAGSLVFREHWWAADQLHVTLFDHADGTAVYAHREANWITQPVQHYRGSRWRPADGVAAVQRLLDEQDVLCRDA